MPLEMGRYNTKASSNLKTVISLCSSLRHIDRHSRGPLRCNRARFTSSTTPRHSVPGTGPGGHSIHPAHQKSRVSTSTVMYQRTPTGVTFSPGPGLWVGIRHGQGTGRDRAGGRTEKRQGPLPNVRVWRTDLTVRVRRPRRLDLLVLRWFPSYVK